MIPIYVGKLNKRNGGTCMKQTNGTIDDLQVEGVKTITIHPEEIKQPAPRKDFASRLEELWNKDTGLLSED